MRFREYESFIVLDCGAFGNIVYDYVLDKVSVNFDSEVPFDDLMRLMRVLKREVNKRKRELAEFDI